MRTWQYIIWYISQTALNFIASLVSSTLCGFSICFHIYIVFVFTSTYRIYTTSLTSPFTRLRHCRLTRNPRSTLNQVHTVKNKKWNKKLSFDTEDTQREIRKRYFGHFRVIVSLSCSWGFEEKERWEGVGFSWRG